MSKIKALCSWFDVIDSFNMFNKYKEGLDWVKNSKDMLCFEIYQYNLKARLMDDYSLSIFCDAGSYIISIEKKPCNFGGHYYFFHCPKCIARMRKLYLVNGVYLCRKCANLCYYTQRLSHCDHLLYMGRKIEKKLKKRAGNINSKTSWMKQHTFKKLRKKYLDYDEKHFHAQQKLCLDLFGQMRHPEISEYYSCFVPYEFFDVYDFEK